VMKKLILNFMIKAPVNTNTSLLQNISIIIIQWNFTPPSVSEFIIRSVPRHERAPPMNRFKNFKSVEHYIFL